MAPRDIFLVSVYLVIATVVYTHAREIDAPLRQGRQGIFGLGSGSSCIGDSTPGVCLSRSQCNLQGGRVVGNCGVFSQCCSLTACDITTNARRVVFSNPPLASASSGLECSYNVQITNQDICQIRLDLEIFSLAQPNTTIGNTTTKYPGWRCEDDVFQVTNLQSFSELVPPLCGENSGQHIYLRVNASLNSKDIRLNFKIADRTSKLTLPVPTWRVRVTQLECFNTVGTYREPSYLDVLTSGLPAANRNSRDIALAENEEGEEPQVEKHVEGEQQAVRQARVSTADRDEYLIAPDGCLQYYPERSGSFESFNYNRGQGPYLSNMHYAICFKRTQDVCGIKLIASNFVVANNNSKNFQMDTDCDGNPYVTGSLDSRDFLFIPDGETADGYKGTKWCGTSLMGQIVASTPPGPLYVYFHSDNVVTNGTREVGFRINYNVLNNCKPSKTY